MVHEYMPFKLTMMDQGRFPEFARTLTKDERYRIDSMNLVDNRFGVIDL